ncbi:hypothetical protein GXW83_20655 [Streptacidiphilus sp. PB12-B1b]|uniref:hypothetical protein n=1 Tax=Streptacidiphilus sp. PB12-B1b TaxID=2705012 RepID=UPI0015FB3B72|nr:hypothetical protein [Streptacidiphilus sp. PB12-B1b]QMU77744.1 hypothetical protein GXW83_20655 [Streptacidiphilus sp. PB12-B1b]
MDDHGIWGGPTEGALALLLTTGWIDIHPGSLRIEETPSGRVFRALDLDGHPVRGALVNVFKIRGASALAA